MRTFFSQYYPGLVLILTFTFFASLCFAYGILARNLQILGLGVFPSTLLLITSFLWLKHRPKGVY